MTLPTFWTFLGCVYVPLLGLLFLLRARTWHLERKAERVPISEKLLRPAGESLRLKIEDLSDKLGLWVLLAIAVPATVAAAILFSPASGRVTVPRLLAALAAEIAVFSAFAVKLFRVARDFRNYRLGFHGERAAGEEINQLMLDGCRVFHDVPMEPYGNIDHVIVAPSGVFAVETKTRRKRKAPPGKRAHEVIYDGKTLEYPHCRDTHGLEQARQQADRLRVLLTKAVGEPVPVAPILTLPGWLVTCRVNTGMKVVNPKQIRAVVASESERKLSPQQIERIAHQLEQKCRDVDL